MLVKALVRSAGWLVILGLCACRSAPRPLPSAPPAPDAGVPADASLPLQAPPQLQPQPGSVIAEVEGVSVLALAAPQFASLSREQRLLAWHVAQALAAGDSLAIDQGYRHNLQIVQILRGILSRPEVVPSALLPRLRDFARVVWLNHGIHDAQTGHKQLPDFTPSELRFAALAAQAAGADLGLHGARLEFALRALEAPLFDPQVDAQRTSRAPDALQHSAVNLYASVTSRDLQGFHEAYPNNSRLVRENSAMREEVYRLPAVADGLEQALPFSAPPQRATLEPLAAFFRSGEPARFQEAADAWLEAAGPVDFFAGFLDASADPRRRKGLYAGVLGVADPERTAALAALAEREPTQARAAALFLASAAGAFRPLPAFIINVGGKSDVFAAAADAVAQLREKGVIGALAEPDLAQGLNRCAAVLRFALLAFRALQPASDEDPAVREVQAGLSANLYGLSHPGAVPAPACARLLPQYTATSLLAAAADLPDHGPIENDRQRAAQLQIWWFTGKGALVERHLKGRRYFSVPEAGRFAAAAGELAQLLRDIARSGDAARLESLFEMHASQADGSLRDEVRQRLRAAGVPLRVAVLPPRLDPILQDGKVIDAQSAPITDLDAEILRSWNQAL